MRYRFLFASVVLVASVAAVRSQAEELPKKTGVDLGGNVKMEFVLIPAGEFMMGSRESPEAVAKVFKKYDPVIKAEWFEDEHPMHRVRITKPFYLGAREVTVGQFRQLVGDTGYKTEPERDGEGGYGYKKTTGDVEGRKLGYTWRNTGFAQTDEHPVVNVTWNDAVAFCEWLGGIGGQKCGGGWFDPYGTTQKTYVEQARQTVLAGAKESLLFCYGSLLNGTGPANVEALRACIPELRQVAEEVGRRQVVGLAAYKPPNSHPEKEPRVFDFVGMTGLPLVPCHEFPDGAKAAFFSVHALKDPKLPEKLTKLIARGVPVLLTDGLAERLDGRVPLEGPNVRVLQVRGDPKSLLTLPQPDLDALRRPLLEPLGHTFRAPNRVALYLFADGSWVVENFQDQPVSVELDGKMLEVPARGWRQEWK